MGRVVMEIAGALLGLWVLVLLWGAWEHRCINKTSTHMRKMSDMVFKKENYRYYLDIYNRASFDDVMRAYRWGKDPMDLYPPQFWSILFEEDYTPSCKRN